MSDTPPTVPVDFKTDALITIPIPPDKKALAKQHHQERKAKLSSQLAVAKVYERLGGKVLKISARTMSALGKHVDELNIRHIGHGRIFLSGEEAITSVGECDALITKYSAQDPPADPSIIIGLMQLKLGFAKLLLETGEAHIKATKQASEAATEPGMNISFPAGGQMLIVSGKDKAPPAPPPVDA